MRLHHVTARQQRLVFTLNLHVILTCLLRDFALLCRGVDFHFFFSLMFCEHMCVFRERLTSYDHTTPGLFIFSSCMIKTTVPCALKLSMMSQEPRSTGKNFRYTCSNKTYNYETLFNEQKKNDEIKYND